MYREPSLHDAEKRSRRPVTRVKARALAGYHRMEANQSTKVRRHKARPHRCCDWLAPSAVEPFIPARPSRFLRGGPGAAGGRPLPAGPELLWLQVGKSQRVRPDKKTPDNQLNSDHGMPYQIWNAFLISFLWLWHFMWMTSLSRVHSTPCLLTATHIPFWVPASRNPCVSVRFCSTQILLSKFLVRCCKPVLFWSSLLPVYSFQGCWLYCLWPCRRQSFPSLICHEIGLLMSYQVEKASTLLLKCEFIKIRTVVSGSHYWWNTHIRPVQ